MGIFKVLLSPVKGFSPYSVFEAHKSFPFGEERHFTSGVTSTSNRQECLLTNDRLTISFQHLNLTSYSATVVFTFLKQASTWEFNSSPFPWMTSSHTGHVVVLIPEGPSSPARGEFTGEPVGMRKKGKEMEKHCTKATLNPLTPRSD